VTPYTTRAGVQIGLAYIPRAIPITGDHIRLQAALLDSRTNSRPSLIARVLAPFWRLC
jgi:hypothetical protein